MSHSFIQNPDQLMQLTSLKGVGANTADRLQRIGIHSVEDLLFHLPLRYQDRSRVVPIAQLVAGTEVVVRGSVVSSTIQFGKRRSLVVTISDDTGLMKVRFFHFSMNQKSALVEGAEFSCFGEVRQSGFRTGRAGSMEMIHPEYRCGDQLIDLTTEDRLTPVYPVTEGLQQRSIRSFVSQAFEHLESNSDFLKDCLPQSILDKYGFDSLKDAIDFIHQPACDTSVAELSFGKHPSQQRLVFEELLARHLCLKQLRNKVSEKPAISIKQNKLMLQKVNSLIPFSLTHAQQICVEQVLADLEKAHPMQRLVQGDVGCGKTIVAIISAFHAALAGHQVAIMAPTEILAEQHYLNFTQYAADLGIEVSYLSGKIKGSSRKEVIGKIESGDAKVVIGTHALFQDEVVFRNLAYIVVDEQHRFGVEQRLKLLNKGLTQGCYPHQLIMSATPIPRSLAMSLYADLDCSIIDEMPPGRSPVNSSVISEDKREDIIARVAAACSEGRQAYWVCPLIEESEVLQCQAAVDTQNMIQQILSNLRVGLIHGRMKSVEKETIMNAFKQGEIDILVATTVIEVGIDVANASLMVIENSERLGLSQLHQLRGRVGRGEQSSNCIFMYSAPLSSVARKRLTIMRETTDGFEIARQDMTMRGPGEVLGTQQTGLMQFRIADLPRDEYLLPKVQQAADQLLLNHPVASQAIINRWVGQSVRYLEA